MKKFLLLTILLIVCGTAAAAILKVPRKPRPNVILVILDAARPDHFSCYGYAKKTTPHIDAIAKNGTLFRNHFSQGKNTFESLSQVFFSRYYTLHILDEDGFIWGIKLKTPKTLFRTFSNDQVLLTDILSAAGYRTAVFSDNPFFQPQTDLFKSFGHAEIRYQSYNFSQEIVDWIKKDKTHPGFIYWHITLPHIPYIIQEDNNLFLNGFTPEMIESVRKKMHYAMTQPDSFTLTESETQCVNALYDCNLKLADTLVGKLYSELQSAGMMDTTALFITSDHGENLGEHKPFTHGGAIPWDSLIKTPLIISYPALFKKNHTENRFTEAIDIMPTILDICRIPLPPGKRMDGISLRWYLNQLYFAKKAVYSLHAVRTAEYKYIIDKKMLFDLKNDPHETKNIADKKPAITHYLTKLYIKTILPEIKTAKYSRKKLPPDYAFYIPIYSFTADPEDEIQTGEFLNTFSREPAQKKYFPKPWAYGINKEFILRTSLYRVPKTPAIPLRLSAEIPNSEYRIYMLLKTNQKLTLPVSDIGLRYSFTSSDLTQTPREIEETTINQYQEEFYYYADLGISTVKNKNFSLTLNFQPEGNSAYEICSIKFVSRNAQNHISLPGEIEGQRQRLQSLGYM